MPIKASFFTAVLLYCLIHTASLHAQTTPLRGQGTQYKIGTISVVGSQQYNEQTIIAYTGLKTGDMIYLPGDRISDVIKKLWNIGLFSDISIEVKDVRDNVVDLELQVEEVPELNKATITGIKERKIEDLIEETDLEKGTKVTENLITKTKNYIENKYKEDGYLNSSVTILTKPIEDTTTKSKKVNMLVTIDKSDRVKIKDINFENNEQLSDGKLRKQMKNTKQRNFLRFWKRSKYIADDYEEDKENIINKYKEKGYRDARIISDTLIRDGEGLISLQLNLEEGNKYYIGDIDFIGNTVYTDAELQRQLGLSKGDVYNGVLLKERISKGDPQAEDLANLYKNNGYLFSSINPVEVDVQNDTIDFEVRITEGKLAYFDKISVTGNTKTKDRVIYRNLRTRPGQRYSQAAVLQTVRELGQTGFFDPEQLNPEFLNANPNDGTIDINYDVVEQGASQIELQGGYGGGGFVGTLGLTFNNFSIQNIFNKEAYQPLPMGDGQQFSLRAQASTFYRTYSASLTEPWLGGKKPVQASLSFSHSQQFRYDFSGNRRRAEPDRDQSFTITGGSIGLSTRLERPDPYFYISHALSFQHFDLKNYNVGLFTFGNGSSENLAYTIGISRNEGDANPIFPRSGSKFSLTAKLTPPYSLFNGVDYEALAERRAPLAARLAQDPNNSVLRAQVGEIDQERFNWLEYYKVKMEGQWFTSLIGKLVLSSKMEFGFLGAYNNDRGIPPFDRFFLGGDGLGGYALDGREIIRLRGYPNQSVVPIDRDPSNTTLTQNDGATVYNKFEFELRYPITLKPSASIYMLTFAEGGSTYDNFRDYNPFLLNRSAGAGIRIFMPAFGLLGIDFGYGFDSIPGTVGPNGWETHFIIGQQF